MLLALALLQAGGDLEVSAALEKESVQLGETVLLRLDVIGDMAADCEVTDFPRSPDLYVERLGSRMFKREDSIQGGEGVLVTRFQYRLYALSTGTITVPSIEVTARGRFKARSEPLQLEVAERSSYPDIASVFISLPGGRRFFVHEPIVFVVSLGVPERGLKAPRLVFPLSAGTQWLLPMEVKDTGEEIEPSQPVRVIELNRKVRFTVVPGSAAGEHYLSADFHFLPLRSGEFESGPALFAWGEGMADDPVEYAVCTSQVFRIAELPGEGRPASFTNAVGAFEVTFEVAPRKVRVGESLFLRFSITGKGNNEFIVMPDFPELAGSFRIFRKTDEREDGAGWPAYTRRRSFELSPFSTAVERIPPLAFAFFDPEKERYETVKWKGVPIAVLPGEGGGAPGPAVREPAADIATIIEDLPSRSQWLPIAIHILLAFCALAALVAWLEGRLGWLKAVSLAVQRKRALRELQDGIAKLRSAQTGACDALARLLAAFLAERFGILEAEILSGGAERALRARGIGEDFAADTARLLERLDAERFRTGKDGGELPAELFDEALRIAGRLEGEGAS
jgi:hypothetical protein